MFESSQNLKSILLLSFCHLVAEMATAGKVSKSFKCVSITFADFYFFYKGKNIITIYMCYDLMVFFAHIF